MSDVRLLVGGMARSGTTLAQRLLCELDDVWVAPETHFWRYAPELTRRFDAPLSHASSVEAMHWLLQQPSVHYLDVDAGHVCRHLRDGAGLWDLFVALVRALSPTDVGTLGEKTPDHLLWAGPLLDRLPALHVVGVVRDPRAVLRSHQEVPWGISDVDQFGRKWSRHSATLRHLLDRHPDRVLAVRHEDMTLCPDAFRTKVAERLDVAVTARPIDDRASELFNDGGEWWKREALSTVRESTATWRSDLSPEMVRDIEQRCGPEMMHWDYVPERLDPPPPARMPRADVSDGRGDLPLFGGDRIDSDGAGTSPSGGLPNLLPNMARRLLRNSRKPE